MIQIEEIIQIEVTVFLILKRNRFEISWACQKIHRIPFPKLVSTEFLIHTTQFMLELQSEVLKPESRNTDVVAD